MKIFFIFPFVVLFFTPCRMEMDNALNFAKGFVLGMHFERIHPDIKVCLTSDYYFYKSIVGIIAAFKENQTFYHLMDNITAGMVYIPPICRSCSSMPMNTITRFKELYLKPFNRSVGIYFKAVLINIPYRMGDFEIGRASCRERVYVLV